MSSTVQRTHRMDEEVVTNARGGSQSKLNHTPRLVPGAALVVVRERFRTDLQTGQMPWRQSTLLLHVNAAYDALCDLLATSNREHLVSMFEHLIKAVAVEEQQEGVQPSVIPPEAVLRIAEVTGAGVTKYGENNWTLIHATDHIDHASVHLLQYLAGDRSDDHLGHALCRASFAIAVFPADGWDFMAVRKVNIPTTAPNVSAVEPDALLQKLS